MFSTVSHQQYANTPFVEREKSNHRNRKTEYQEELETPVFSLRTLNLLSEFYIYRTTFKLRGVISPFKKLGRFWELIPI